eukprot:172533-Chlamydomonas_euryale.AAC.2
MTARCFEYQLQCGRVSRSACFTDNGVHICMHTAKESNDAQMPVPETASTPTCACLQMVLDMNSAGMLSALDVEGFPSG